MYSLTISSVVGSSHCHSIVNLVALFVCGSQQCLAQDLDVCAGTSLCFPSSKVLCVLLFEGGKSVLSLHDTVYYCSTFVYSTLLLLLASVQTG